ncbi:MAG: hypothetical protein AAFZ38_00720 [Myxococcota bacterium]
MASTAPISNDIRASIGHFAQAVQELNELQQKTDAVQVDVDTKEEQLKKAGHAMVVQLASSTSLHANSVDKFVADAAKDAGIPKKDLEAALARELGQKHYAKFVKSGHKNELGTNPFALFALYRLREEFRSAPAANSSPASGTGSSSPADRSWIGAASQAVDDEKAQIAEQRGLLKEVLSKTDDQLKHGVAEDPELSKLFADDADPAKIRGHLQTLDKALEQRESALSATSVSELKALDELLKRDISGKDPKTLRGKDLQAGFLQSFFSADKKASEKFLKQVDPSQKKRLNLVLGRKGGLGRAIGGYLNADPQKGVPSLLTPQQLGRLKDAKSAEDVNKLMNDIAGKTGDVQRTGLGSGNFLGSLDPEKREFLRQEPELRHALNNYDQFISESRRQDAAEARELFAMIRGGVPIEYLLLIFGLKMNNRMERAIKERMAEEAVQDQFRKYRKRVEDDQQPIQNALDNAQSDLAKAEVKLDQINTAEEKLQGLEAVANKTPEIDDAISALKETVRGKAVVENTIESSKTTIAQKTEELDAKKPVEPSDFGMRAKSETAMTYEINHAQKIYHHVVEMTSNIMKAIFDLMQTIRHNFR